MLLLATSAVYSPTLKANGSQTGVPASISAPAPKTGVCSGTVVDEEDEPLTGASVLIEGTSNGTSTNIDGKFSLSNVAI